jgi:hypothetical protein
MNRRIAAAQHLSATQAAFDSGKVPVDAVLYAQVRLADAESRYARAVIDYAVAVKNVHLEKGSLLDYNDIVVAGNPKISNDDKHSLTAGARELWDRINYAFSAGDKPPRVVASGDSNTVSTAAADQTKDAATSNAGATGSEAASATDGSTTPVVTPSAASPGDATTSNSGPKPDSGPTPTLAPPQPSTTSTTSVLLH